MASGEEEVRLIVLRGVEGRREYVLEKDVLAVGRPEPGWEPDIPIVADGVLRHHATLRREGTALRVEPQAGALVSVNRKPFAGGLIADGDQIAFGGALLQFWAGGLHGRPPGGATASEAGRGDAGVPPARRLSARARLLLALAIAVGGFLLLLLLRMTPTGPRP